MINHHKAAIEVWKRATSDPHIEFLGHGNGWAVATAGHVYILYAEFSGKPEFHSLVWSHPVSKHDPTGRARPVHDSEKQQVIQCLNNHARLSRIDLAWVDTRHD